MDDDRETFLTRQKALADFGDFALQSEDLNEVLTEACRLVAEAMGTGRAKVLEIEEDGETLLVRAGVGWDEGVVGKLRLPMRERSSETFAIRERRPVISQDISKEDRFEIPDFMKQAGVVSLANVPIMLPGRRAFGLLQVDATEPRDFDENDTEFLRTYAIIVSPIIDRLFKLRDLRSAEQRFRITVEAAQDYAIFITDREDRITDWLPGAAAAYGWSAEEIIGQSGSVLFTPEDREAGEDRKEVETARTEGAARNVRWHMRKDGSRVFIEGSVRALPGGDGVAEGFIKIGQDVTERRAAEKRLERSEERLRLALESGSLGTWDWDLETGQVEWSDEHYRQIGYEVGEVEPGYEAWVSHVHPEDREAAEDAVAIARDQHEPYALEYRIRLPDGAVRWVQARGIFFYDDAGSPVRMIGVQQDVTGRREAQDRQRVLMSELQHRTRNLMGVVNSIGEQTLRTSEDLADFAPMFRERISALARAQGLLSRLKENDRVTFGELIEGELSALGGYDGQAEQITLEGPRGVALRSSTVQILALAIHELCTNALKYGALHQPDGHLSVRWELKRDGGQPWIHVDWRESGLMTPPEGAAPRGGGAGRELIERALPYQLGARTTYVVEEDRIHCTIALPASEKKEAEKNANG